MAPVVIHTDGSQEAVSVMEKASWKQLSKLAVHIQRHQEALRRLFGPLLAERLSEGNEALANRRREKKHCPEHFGGSCQSGRVVTGRYSPSLGSSSGKTWYFYNAATSRGIRQCGEMLHEVSIPRSVGG